MLVLLVPVEGGYAPGTASADPGHATSDIWVSRHRLEGLGCMIWRVAPCITRNKSKTFIRSTSQTRDIPSNNTLLPLSAMLISSKNIQTRSLNRLTPRAHGPVCKAAGFPNNELVGRGSMHAYISVLRISVPAGVRFPSDSHVNFHVPSGASVESWRGVRVWLASRMESSFTRLIEDETYPHERW
jgi:hypothetical protein